MGGANQTTIAIGPGGALDYRKLLVNANGELLIAGAVTGSFTISGLNTAGKNTCMDVTSTATKIPVTPLANRNAIAVTNYGADILYVGFDSGVTADLVPGTTSGFQCGPNQGFNMDITDNVELWAIAPAGKTIRILITELA